MKHVLLSIIMLSSINSLADNIEKDFLENIITNTQDYRKNIHKSIVDISSNIDSFFIPQEIKNLNYKSSYALLELSSYINEGEEISFDQRLKIKLRLPKLKDKFNIELESEEKRETENHVEDHKKDEGENYNLALAYYKLLKNDINLKSRIGIKLKTKLDPFIKVEANKTWKHSNNFEYTLSQLLKQSILKDTESTSYFRIDKRLNDKYSIHNYYQHYWESQEDQYNKFYASVYLNHKVSKKDQLTYTIGSNIDNIGISENEKSNMKAKRYAFSIKYRHYIKKWLYVDTIPENYYKEDQNFKPKYAIRFNLGMYFNTDSY